MEQYDMAFDVSAWMGPTIHDPFGALGPKAASSSAWAMAGTMQNRAAVRKRPQAMPAFFLLPRCWMD